jgi:hypothetical protein
MRLTALSTLFPETTSPASSEPPLWARRLVILDSIDLEPIVVRDIPFQLGLNIVCTRQPAADSTEALGHDVGKTLLTRLLRYVFGEETFAEGRTRTAIRRAFPDSFVAADVRVAGQSWSVVKHLGAPANIPSRAGAVESWRDLLGNNPDPQAYQQFLQAVSDTVLNSIESPMLTHQKRPLRWLDVLAWITRDQKCRYAHPLVWRHRETESENDTLHVEDASTVLRCVAGLMSPKERELFEAHDALLAKQQAFRTEQDSVRGAIAAEEGIIDQDLRQCLNSNDVDVSEFAPEIIRTRTGQLRELRRGERQRRNLDGLRDALDLAIQNRATNVAEERQLAAHLTTAKEHLLQRQNQKPSQSIFEAFLKLCDRPVDDCPAKLRIGAQQIPDPYREEDIARLRAEVQTVESRIADVQALQPDREATVGQARENLAAMEDELSTITSGIDGRIALHDAMLRRVERHLGRLTRRPEVATELAELGTKIQESSEQQRELRDSLAGSREYLSTRFEAICRHLLGASRSFAVAIEAKSIRLNVTGSDGAPGEATSTSALVLSLDLAALRAALDGYGHHPRLAILDSPREADMEIGIFQRLIGLFADWHQASTKPAFQIIMTTTTRPLETLLPPSVICAELSRDPESDLLFRRLL